MLTQLKKLIRINLDDLALCGGVVGGVFLLIHIITALAVRFSDEGSALLLSGVALPIAAGIMTLIVAFSHTMFQFDWAVRYSRTRHRALGLTLGLVGFQALFSMALAALLNLLERSLAPGFWLRLSGREFIVMDGIPAVPVRGLTADEAAYRAQRLFIEDFALDWWWWLVIVLGGLVLGLIAGAIFQRFGSKGGWFLWGFWMFFLVGFQLLPWRTYEITNWLIPLLVLAVLAASVWSIWSLLHAVIKA